MTRVAATAALALVALASCSDDSGADRSVASSLTTTTTTVTSATDAGDDTVESSSPGGATKICGPIRPLASYNALNETDLTGEWSEVQPRLVEVAEESDRLYGEAVAAAPEGPRGWLTSLRDFSNEVLVAASQADSVEDMRSVVTERAADVPDDVTSAVLDLDAYLKKTCGFGLSPG